MMWSQLKLFYTHRSIPQAKRAIAEVLEFMGVQVENMIFTQHSSSLLKAKWGSYKTKYYSVYPYISTKDEYYFGKIGIHYPEISDLNEAPFERVILIAELEKGSLRFVFTDGHLHKGFQFIKSPTPFQNQFIVLYLADYFNQQKLAAEFWHILNFPSYPRIWLEYISSVRFKLNSLVELDSLTHQLRHEIIQYLLLRILRPIDSNPSEYVDYNKYLIRITKDKNACLILDAPEDSIANYLLTVNEKLNFSFRVRKKLVLLFLREVYSTLRGFDFDCTSPLDLIQSFAIRPDLFYNSISLQFQSIQSSQNSTFKFIPISSELYRFVLFDIFSIQIQLAQGGELARTIVKSEVDQMEHPIFKMSHEEIELSTYELLNRWIRPAPYTFAKYKNEIISGANSIEGATKRKMFRVILNSSVLCVNPLDYTAFQTVLYCYVSARMTIENVTGLNALLQVLHCNLTILRSKNLDEFFIKSIVSDLYYKLAKFENLENSPLLYDILNSIRWLSESDFYLKFSDTENIYDIIIGQLKFESDYLSCNEFAEENKPNDSKQMSETLVSKLESATYCILPISDLNCFSDSNSNSNTIVRDFILNNNVSCEKIRIPGLLSHPSHLYFRVNEIDKYAFYLYPSRKNGFNIDKWNLLDQYSNPIDNLKVKVKTETNRNEESFYKYISSLRNTKELQRVKMYRGGNSISEYSFLLTRVLGNEICKYFSSAQRFMTSIITSGDICEFKSLHSDYIWFTPDMSLLAEMEADSYGCSLLYDCRNSVVPVFRKVSSSQLFNSLPIYGVPESNESSQSDWIIAIGNLAQYPRAALFPRNTVFYNDCIIIDPQDPYLECSILNSFIFKRIVQPYYSSMIHEDTDIATIIYNCFPFIPFHHEVEKILQSIVKSEFILNPENQIHADTKLTIDILVCHILNIAYEWVQLINPEISEFNFILIQWTNVEFSKIVNYFANYVSDDSAYNEANFKYIDYEFSSDAQNLITTNRPFVYFDSNSRNLILSTSVDIHTDDIESNSLVDSHFVCCAEEKVTGRTLYGVFNNRGNLVLDFFYSNTGLGFWSDRFLSIERDEKYRVMDFATHTLQELKFDSVTDYPDGPGYSNFELVKLVCSEGDRYIEKVGVIDFEGNLIIQPIYCDLYIRNDCISVYNKKYSPFMQNQLIFLLKANVLILLRDFEDNLFTWSYTGGLIPCEKWPD